MCRDDFLTEQDVRNLAATMKKELYQLADQDAQSVRLWVRSHPEQVLLYQEFQKAAGDEEDHPFILCIQHPWQLDMMRQHGHQDLLSFDATFGTNKFRVSYVAMHNLLYFSMFEMQIEGCIRSMAPSDAKNRLQLCKRASCITK